jgi:WD40 repeat protein
LDRVARDEPDEPEIDATLRAVQSGKIADARSVETTAMPWQSTASELWDIARSLGRSLVPANPIRIAADARLALTGSHDARVRLWDLRTGQCRLTLEGHSRLVLAVDVSPDGRVGVSASEDDTIRVWDLTAGRCLHVLNAVPPRKDKLLDCAVRLSADGRFVLWAGDGKVLLWDLHDTRRTMIHEGHFGAAIGLSVDGRLALFADGRHIRLWEPASRRGWGWQTLNLPESQSSSAVCVSADRRMAVTGARYDGTIRLWNLETGRCVRTLTGHTDRVQALSMSPDSRYLLSGGEDATVRLWDLDSGCCLRTFRGPENYVNVSEVGLDGGAREGISVSSDNTIRHWRMPGGYMAVPQLSRPRPHDELTRLRSLVEAQVGQAEQAIADGALPAALDLLTRVRSTPGYERAPRVLSAWRTLARSSVRVGLRAAWPVRVLTTGSIYSADLSQDGRIAATCGSDGTIRLWNVESGTCCRVIDADPHRVGSRPVESVCLSADGERILSGCGDGVVRLWSVETGECLRVLAGNDRNALSVRFSADDSQALVGVWGGVVQLWDLSAGSLLWTLEGHTKGLHGSSAGVSDVWAGPAGRLIASAGHDGLVRFAELESGRCMRTIDAHGGVVKSMCLSTDGRFALSSGGYGDRTIRLWDVATGKHVRCLDEHPRHEPNTVRLTTDDRFAVSAGGDATVRVWDVSTGACLCVLEGHRKSASGVAVSSDGRFVLSWGLGDGTARLWELDWELAAREPADWDDGATPYLEVFLARHGQRWTAGDVTGLLHHLEDAGYGWLRAGGVRARLDRMAAELAG